jgi:SAM-dependent methyltransferase
VPWSPDRVFLQRVILPRIARRGGSALLVGCRRYTAHDPIMLEGHGVACWTLDIDPEVMRWGAMGRHVIAPIEQAASRFHPAMFDTVLLSGVFGFGIDDVKAQEAAIVACATVLKPGGLLVLGWNADLLADPSMLMGITRHFGASRDAELVDRVTFRGSTHIFDFYARRRLTDGVGNEPDGARRRQYDRLGKGHIPR